MADATVPQAVLSPSPGATLDPGVEGDVFANLDVSNPDVREVNHKDLVFNTHILDGQFKFHPGDKVPGKFLRNLVENHGWEMYAELLRCKTMVPSAEYKPDLSHAGFAVESYGHPTFHNQGSPDGESVDLDEMFGYDDEPAMPAVDKSNIGDATVQEPDHTKNRTVRSTDSKEPVTLKEQKEGEK
jgi:hypothetical protein